MPHLLYAGGGPLGMADELPLELVGFRSWCASNLSRDRSRNSCLLFQTCCLSANPWLCASGGGGSVIFVIKYAVLASAMP